MRSLFAASLFAFAWLAPATPADALGCILLGCDCSVTADDIDFGEFNPLVDGTQDAMGRVTVSCSGLVTIGAGVTVELGTGQWGSYAARKLRSSTGDTLDYNIYTTAQYGTVWGNGTSGTLPVQLAGGLIALGHWSRSRDMFASMPLLHSAQPGEYSDTVIVRVVW